MTHCTYTSGLKAGKVGRIDGNINVISLSILLSIGVYFIEWFALAMAAYLVNGSMRNSKKSFLIDSLFIKKHLGCRSVFHRQNALNGMKH